MTGRLKVTGRKDDEQGAVAIIVALLAVVLFGMAAMAVDLASQTSQKQQLHDTLDTGALSGAMLLPDDWQGARDEALAVALANDPDATPVVTFWCIVAVTGTPPAADASAIPRDCDPGAPGAPYTSGRYPGLRLNATTAAIPCFPDQRDKCNAIEVSDNKDVPFAFAPVIGMDHGNTGPLHAVAWKATTTTTNPIDLAVIADRTGSMGGRTPAMNDIPASGNSLPALETGVKNLLEYLTPSQNRVALGTIGHTRTNAAACEPAGSDPASDATGPERTGNWIIPPSVGINPYLVNPFSDQYQDDLTDVTPPSNPASLNASDWVARAADCLGNGASSTGTWLASPLKFAARALLGLTDRPEAKKGIVFMTDGVPREQNVNEDSTGPLSLSDNRNIGDADAKDACNNVQAVARNAKDSGIFIATIAYRMTAAETCENGKTVLEMLAAVASPRADGTPSKDDGGGAGAGCDTLEKVARENADGDFFFCGAEPDDLEQVFATAATQIAGGGVRLIALP